MEKRALVVKRDILFKQHYFQGFAPLAQHDFLILIQKNHSYHLRGNQLENDESLQQIIPYVWIIDPSKKSVFAYKRSAGKDYQEKRLHSKFSCGVGGHIEQETEKNVSDPVMAAMIRELKEEVTMETYPTPTITGYINDDRDAVGRVHFGIVGVVETTLPVTKGDDEMVSGQFYTKEELEKAFADPSNDVEAWTQLTWPFIRDTYLI